MSYSAIITRIKTKPHPNADKIQLGTVAGGAQVVVGLETQDGELGVYFPCDGQLSHEFCVANKLYRTTVAAGFGVEGGGFFELNRRVRSQKFRGEISEGFWIPLDSLLFLVTQDDLDTLKEGDLITSFYGSVVCEKYETAATKAAKAGTPKMRKDTPNFPKVGDTMQFRFLDQVPRDAILYVTEKLHGTSGRHGLVWDDVPQTWWQRWLGLRIRKRWQALNGSKNVILEKSTGIGWYGSDYFRYAAVADALDCQELHKGEVLYFELVGWVDPFVRIMPAHDNTKLNDKTIVVQYGNKMDYLYGTSPGECKLYVYKILNVNQDGVVFELSWPGVKARCKELGLNHVPELAGPKTIDELRRIYSTDNHIEAVSELVGGLTDGPSTLSSKHIREGIVLRIESSDGIKYVKNKSFTFKVLEGIIKEDDTYVDIEEIS